MRSTATSDARPKLWSEDVSLPEKGYFDEEVYTLEEALDRHPCVHCGHHYNDHFNLTQTEIWDARDQGCTVDVCTTRRRWTFSEREGPPAEDEVKWCLVIQPLDDPCDADYMEEIST